MPDDAVASGNTSKLWRIIFNGLGAKGGDALAFVYVSPSGDDSNDGSSWTKAKKTIGGALNGITDATDTKRYIVLIGAGTYSPSAPLSLKNYVALIGGFEDLNNGKRGTTTISGKNDKQVFKNENLDNPSKSTAVLAGVTITKGKGEEGGGMYNNNSSPTVVHTTFSGNTVTGTNGRGGGMSNFSSPTTVTNTTFSGNTVTGTNGRGGGMYNRGIPNENGSSPVISSSIFWGNTKGATFDQIDNDSSATATPVVAHSIVQGDYPGGTDIYLDDPLLEALANNGGFVKTMALKAGSPAINKGLYFARERMNNDYSKDGSTWYTEPTLTEDETDSFPPGAVRDDTDARGYGYNGHPDIGAYEYGGTAP